MGKHSHSGRGTKSDSRSRSDAVSVEDTRPVSRGANRLDVDEVVQTRRKHRLRRALLIVVAVLLLLCTAAGVWALIFITDLNHDVSQADPKAVKALTKNDPAAATPGAPFNMLLLGADKRGNAGDSRSDTIVFARIDPGAKRIWLLSLPRDTKAEIPGYGVGKLNKAYQEGGAALAIDTVEQLLGLPINHYMEVNVGGFRRIVSALGGVWVNVDTNITDPKAADSQAKPEDYTIKAGYQRLNPQQALVFVRSRAFPDADFTRMRHQQAFFRAVMQQSLQVGNLLKLPTIVRETASFTRTDMTASQLVRLALTLRGMSDEDLQTATMAGEWRSPYVYTDETLKADLLSRMMSGQSFDASSTPTIVPADVAVGVRNGSGLAGVAAKAADILKAGGFDVTEVGNAKRSTYAETLVVYSGTSAAAEAVRKVLGQGRLVQNAGQYAYSADVLVVVGKDWR
jgi:LCP family protein required for cell wall assembly